MRLKNYINLWDAGPVILLPCCAIKWSNERSYLNAMPKKPSAKRRTATSTASTLAITITPTATAPEIAVATTVTIMDEIIRATRLERERIEDPKNRTRYFIYNKADGVSSDLGCAMRFKNVPERVLRDARWQKNDASLFKVGDIFVAGTTEALGKGVRVHFAMEEINRLGIDMEDLQRASESGIEYIMDSRDLVDHMTDFLEDRANTSNDFLAPLVEHSKTTPISFFRDAIVSDGLNASQKAAVQKALEQKVTFFWGPPGTGKTKTMATLAANLIQNGRRVLLCALSNTALDQLLLTTCAVLKNHFKGHPAIARLGSTMHEKCFPYGKQSFLINTQAGNRGSVMWAEHVQAAPLVAANFTLLSLPRGTHPGLFDYVIADEVSMANIPSLAVASFFAKTGLVVGGDPFQLPPIFPEDAEMPNEWFSSNVFDKAGILEHDDPRAAFLDTQYRMQEEIGSLVSGLFYSGKLKTGTASFPLAPNGFAHRVLFVDISGEVKIIGGSFPESGDERRYNEPHAKVAAQMALECVENGIAPADIGIIVPYNAQVVKVVQKLSEIAKDTGARLAEIKVSTVHSFQGQERKAIIVDFTDENTAPTRLTAKWELINVALSRAKEQLILIGNREYLTNPQYFSPEEITIFEAILRSAQIIKR